MISTRHFFVVDADGNRVGKFDIQSERGRKDFDEDLPDDLSIEEIDEDRETALNILGSTDVDWDERVLE